MRGRGAVIVLMAGGLVSIWLIGCESLPESGASPGISGADTTVAARPAPPQRSGPLLGGLTAGMPPGAAFLVGAQPDKIRGAARDRAEARQALTLASTHPATVDDVDRSSTADLNSDGFVTSDEIAAMSRAGLSEEEMLRRLEATGQVFELTIVGRGDLVEQGVSRRVVDGMEKLNRAERDRVLRLRGRAAETP